jgi:isopenicillin-N N-acyltransferase like protein
VKQWFRLYFCGRHLLILLPFLIFALGRGLPAHASSLWAAIGSSVRDGGALVGKNYDGQPVSLDMRMVVPQQGVRYLGLFPLNSKKGQGPVAGINEKGLAVASAAPETISVSKMAPSAERVTEGLLTGFETVDALLSAPHPFKKGFPVFYLVADARKIALIEIPPHGEAVIKTIENGTLAHTNHYINEKLAGFNKKPNKQSELRLERLSGLMGGTSGPMTAEDFIAASKDRGTGPDDAILRLNGPSGAERTIATWVLWFPKTSPPELHIGFFGADNTEREYDFRLDRSFWTEGVE